MCFIDLFNLQNLNNTNTKYKVQPTIKSIKIKHKLLNFFENAKFEDSFPKLVNFFDPHQQEDHH